MNEEPTVLGGLILGLATAVLAAVSAFGVKVTPGQAAAIMALLTAVIAVVTFLIRQNVVPLSKHQVVVRSALAMPPVQFSVTKETAPEPMPDVPVIPAVLLGTPQSQPQVIVPGAPPNQ